MLPFLVESSVHPVRLFELNDGRFQLLESAAIGPFLPGFGYLLVEHSLAEFLIAAGVERIACEDAVIFDRPSGNEYRTHVRIRVGQYFKADQIADLDLTGPRLLVLNDEYYFVSEVLRDLLQKAAFGYLRFTEGLTGYAAVLA